MEPEAGKELTSWMMHIQFRSTETLVLESNSPPGGGGHPFLSMICSIPERDSQTGWVFPFSSEVTISSNTRERLTFWIGVHPFLLVVLIFPNIGEGLTSWISVHPFWSVVLICSNTGEGLTNWMGIYPFLSVVLLCSNTGEGLTPCRDVHRFLSMVAQTLERDSQAGWVFTHSCQ